MGAMKPLLMTPSLNRGSLRQAAGLLALCTVLLGGLVQAAPGATFRRLPVKEYRDKMKGGWIGQIAGVSWGAPTEFKWRDRIIPRRRCPTWRPA